MLDDQALSSAAKRPTGWFHSIQWRLIVVFGLTFSAILILIELVGFFGIPLTPYVGPSGYYRQEAAKGLSLIADLKEERLKWWVNERRSDMDVLARNETQIIAIQSLLNFWRDHRGRHTEPAALWAEVQRQPEYLSVAQNLGQFKMASDGCRRLFVIDEQTGTVVISTDPASLGESQVQRQFLTAVEHSERDYVSDVQISAKERVPVLYFSRGIRLLGQEPMAVLVEEVDSDALIKPILHTGEGLGEQGEAILVNRQGQSLTSLKYPLPDGTRFKPLESVFVTEAVMRALQNETGTTETTDYRGRRVLAAHRFIQITPTLGWGLIVKRDVGEMLAPLEKAMLASFWLGFAGVIATVLLTVVVARGMTKPLRRLGQAAQEVALGNLAARAPVVGDDEVGTLATTFNAMVEQLEKSRELLRRQERLAALGQLTATVSHEIRNPLGTIRTSFYVIAQRVRGKGLNVEVALDRVERNILRCDGIITDLLDYSRIRPLDLKPTHIDAWLSVMLGEQELPENVVVTRDFATEVQIPLDRERFRRCLVNLISNASQAMAPHGGRLTVSTRIEEVRLVIRVADTGPGIPPEKLEIVFEPLYSTKNFGVGLGLCIVKQIVEQHGGDISLASQPGQGTTAIIRLPLLENEETNGV